MGLGAMEVLVEEVDLCSVTRLLNLGLCPRGALGADLRVAKLEAFAVFGVLPFVLFIFGVVF